MKRKAFISSVLIIVLCLSLMASSAFALFTDKSTVSGVITAGNVEVAVQAENLKLSSTLGENLPQTSVTYAGSTVVVERMVPGDVVSFDLRISNYSDVTIQYRTAITLVGDTALQEKLVVTIDGQSRSNWTSAWAKLEPEGKDIVVSVTVSLPESADNAAQGASCSFAYTVEAMQGNGSTLGESISDGIYYDESEMTYHISDASGLLYFVSLVNAGDNFAGKTVVLTDDIDLDGMIWTPIQSFAGELDGNGKTISNFQIVVDEDNTRGGLFNVIESGDGERVHDLTISNVKATVGAGRFGTLAVTVEGIVNRVTVENVEVTTTSEDAWVGGMCAFLSWGWMNDCTVKDLTVNAQAGASFVAGFTPVLQKNSNMVFTNCNVDGFKVTINSDTGAQVGGFAGQTQRGWENPALKNCSVSGIDIVASGLVNIGGFIANPGAHTTATDCHTAGKIDATGLTGGAVGGFFCDLGWNDDLAEKGGHQITDCTADVDIATSIVAAGGFVGSATNSNDRSMPATFTNCTASGDITSTGSASIGGFAGEADRGTYNQCKATGAVGGQAASEDNFIGLVLEDADITINP